MERDEARIVCTSEIVLPKIAAVQQQPPSGGAPDGKILSPA
jgi:hypothetical protein